MSLIHILQVPYVLTRVGKMESKNPWAKRSRCGRCRSLKPTGRFHLCRWYPNPTSETGLWYGGHCEWICADCVKANRKAWFMPKRTFERLHRKTINGLYPERSNKTQVQNKPKNAVLSNAHQIEINLEVQA